MTKPAPAFGAVARAAGEGPSLDTSFSRLDTSLSARSGASRWQRLGLAAITGAGATALFLAPKLALSCISATLAVVFASLLCIRLYAIRSAWWRCPQHSAPRSHPPRACPPYTVLVTLYREAPVAASLVAALEALHYPKDRLDIVFVLEVDDHATRTALDAAHPPPHMRIVTVPEGAPRTKPRALCYGLTFAQGEYVVVYDAEDRPEPDQLLRALDAFERGGPALGCLQARLNVYNRHDSIVAMQFTIEYTALFDGILPALVEAGAPVPLGGTSNHFRRRALDETGGWDPWNVTEDADLGYRLARRGWQVAALASTTWEEAPPNWRTWLNQRTRWQKGWMQTYLVHMRDPARLWSDLGAARFLWFQAVLGGGLLASLAHPWFLGLLLAEAASGDVLPSLSGGPSAWLSWIALANLAAAALATIALSAITVRARGFRGMTLAVLLSPLMWLPVSLAAYRALVELFRRPFHWAKTPHGAAAGEGMARDVEGG